MEPLIVTYLLGFCCVLAYLVGTTPYPERLSTLEFVGLFAVAVLWPFVAAAKAFLWALGISED